MVVGVKAGVRVETMSVGMGVDVNCGGSGIAGKLICWASFSLK